MACPPRPETGTGSGGASSPEQVAIAAIFLKLSLLNRAYANQVWAREYWKKQKT